MSTTGDTQPGTPPSDSVDTPQPRNCFICYLNEAESPNLPWVNACNCTLEAHESCMLQWIIREEHDGRQRDGIRCPQCKALIVTEEPYDPIVAVRNSLHNKYSRISPLILLTIVSSGGIAGSAWYGYSASATFAGTESVVRWLFGRRRNSPATSIVLKLWGLSAIGPALIITRALPRAIGSFLFVPLSIFYGAPLVAKDGIPSWPPSPEWAMTLMPCVHFAYSYLYRELLGPLERRLNRDLRGGNLDNTPAAGDHAPAEVAPPANDVPPREQGLLANGLALTQAVLGFFQGGEMEAGLDIEVGMDPIEEGGDNQQPQGQPQEGLVPGPPADQPPPDPGQQQQQPPQQDQAQNQRNNNNDAIWPTLADITNNLATSLLFPGISYLMGELIRKGITSSWATAPLTGVIRSRGLARSPTGLLQHQWGRSLVGGCLFVVLKDAFVLYAKHRRVLAKQNRRVKGVPKRGTSPTPSTGEYSAPL